MDTLTLPRIFWSALDSTFQGKTLTSFSMLRGFGFGKLINSLKNASLSALVLDTVSGYQEGQALAES